MRVLLTGATGYLGSHVLRVLMERGHQVTVLVRSPDRLPTLETPPTHLVVGDLRDGEAVHASLKDVDSLVHCAAAAAEWLPRKCDFLETNVTATEALLRAGKDAGLSKMVFTSTIMALGPTGPGEEGTESAPGSLRPPLLPYVRTKRKMLSRLTAAQSQGLPVVITYPGLLYGPGPETTGNFLSRLARKLERGQIPVLPNPKGIRWCLAQVEDVALGHALALERAESGTGYVLGGDNIALDAIFDVLVERPSVPPVKRSCPRWLFKTGVLTNSAWAGVRGVEPLATLGGAQAFLSSWKYSSERAIDELGYAPRPTIENLERWLRGL